MRAAEHDAPTDSACDAAAELGSLGQPGDLELIYNRQGG